MSDLPAPKPYLVNNDIRYRTCGCGCHAIYHDRDDHVCRYYEECGCEGLSPELVEVVAA